MIYSLLTRYYGQRVCMYCKKNADKVRWCSSLGYHFFISAMQCAANAGLEIWPINYLCRLGVFCIHLVVTSLKVVVLSVHDASPIVCVLECTPFLTTGNQYLSENYLTLYVLFVFCLTIKPLFFRRKMFWHNIYFTGLMDAPRLQRWNKLNNLPRNMWESKIPHWSLGHHHSRIPPFFNQSFRLAHSCIWCCFGLINRTSTDIDAKILHGSKCLPSHSSLVTRKKKR